MTGIACRRIVQLSRVGSVSAGTGCLAAIIVTGRTAAFAWATQYPE